MERISLKGDWLFAPESHPEDARTVTVPGSWKTEPGMKNCEAGTYSTHFTLEEGRTGKLVFLRFECVYRTAKISINGTKVGSHEGFQAPFEIDISGAVRAGDNLLEVFADGRRQKDDYLGFSSIYELIPYDFDGICGPVSLELREQQELTGLYTPVDPDRKEALFLFDTFNGSADSAEGTLLLEIRREEDLIIKEKFPVLLTGGEGEIRFSLPLSHFDLWSPEHPVLYDVEARLEVGGKAGTFRCRTGFKRLETRGTTFYLNGSPYYLLGYGDDAVFAHGLPFGKDSSFFEPFIRRAKEYGFNYARHHSHFPSEAYLEAADRMGLLIQPEMALANAPRERLDEQNAKRFLAQWRELIRAYRHHPCIAVWCGGNEMEWGFPFNKELYREAKRLDPYRPAASTDGCFMACDVDDSFDFASIVPAEYTDYLPVRELQDMFLRDRCGKPQVIHEMGNFATVFNIDDLPRLEKAGCSAARTKQVADTVRDRGCRELYDRARANALELQKYCHKLNIEKARLSPEFCGYHVWTLTDYYETTQGLLNIFYEDKAFTAEEFSRINRQCVLLWDTEHVVYRAGQPFRAEIKLSRYGSDEPFTGTVTLTLSGKEGVLGREKACREFRGHGVLDAMSCEFNLPDTAREEGYTLQACLEYGREKIKNSWELFAVPSVRLSTDKEIYIHYLSRYIVEDGGVPVRHYTVPQPIGEGQLILTGHLYPGMLQAVENGASMMFLAGADTFEKTVTQNSFKSPWWDPGEIWYLNHTNNRQISGVVEKGPATDMLPYTGVWKADLFGAVEQACAIDMDALGLDAEPLIYGIDTHFDRLAYLLQFALGRGKVLVCSLNHSRTAMKDPAVEYVIKALINYAMSAMFAPKKRLTAQQFTSALKA